MLESLMVEEDFRKACIAHLRGQFERAWPILFTGAGFSSAAKNIRGQDVPMASALRQILWPLCFPGKPFDEASSLPDLYEHARIRHGAELVRLLVQVLTVNADSLPAWYQTFFEMPWAACYTVNIDDIESAVSRRFELPRNLISVSATNPQWSAGVSKTDGSSLDVVHLNGTLQDLPDGVTFSVTQYGERLGRIEPWYFRLVADLVSHPFVFVGSQLDEPPLWQYIELRRSKGGREARELRPRSYLVTQQLPVARQALLAEFNVVWLPMYAQEFATEVLAQLQPSASVGLELAKRRAATEVTALSDVASLARHPLHESDFLLGAEPIWADLQTGRAIHREGDEALWKKVEGTIGRETTKGLIVVTGTAGSGKSTTLMRTGLRLAGEGIRVGWIDTENEISSRALREIMKSEDAPPVLMIDDADLYGSELAPLVREISLSDTNPLVFVAVRSGKVERVLNPVQLEDLPYSEVVVPLLTDADIGALIDVLDRESRLGILKGRPREEQERLFREQAGRELLVAMIQATSGRRFEEKAVDELHDLEQDGRLLYALVALASALRYSLTTQDLLVASGYPTNAALNTIEQLRRRGIISAAGGAEPAFRARHRVIAELIVNDLQRNRQLADPLSGLVMVAATKARPDLPRTSRPTRFLRSVINHDFLIRTVGVEVAKNIYGLIEQPLAWSFHYWLQRGSLEVEFGDLALAENFLNQARNLAPEDPYVENEYAYLLFKKAIDVPGAVTAPEMANEALESLHDLIRRRGKSDYHPYHVLGSQGLAWARRGIASEGERKRYLRGLVVALEDGVARHPKETQLRELL